MLADSIHISLEGGSVSVNVNLLYLGIVAAVIVLGVILILLRKTK
jgi:hypothetical protein